jgi:hypothetical protein
MRLQPARTPALAIAVPPSAALVWLALALLTGFVVARPVRAQPEPPDSTRLDVERLPPEAIAPSREMYARGFHLRAELGGQGFAGGVGRISSLGPLALIAAGYEFTRWFALAAEFGLAMHETNAPAPPAATAFQVYTALLQARLQLPISARVAIWLSADGGAGLTSGHFLQTYGYQHAGDIGLVYGGALGFDWHFFNPHHSIGLRAGGHLYPNLAAPSGERALAIEATAYLKYVF